MRQYFIFKAICKDSDIREGVSGCFPVLLATVKKRTGAVNDYSIEARDGQREHKSGQRASGGWCIGSDYPSNATTPRSYGISYLDGCDTVLSTLSKSRLILTSHTVGSPRLNAKGGRGVSIVQRLEDVSTAHASNCDC